MILTCPECKSRYVVNPAALMPGGRTVRCAKCRHSWFENKPDEDVAIVPQKPKPDAASEQPATPHAPDQDKSPAGDKTNSENHTNAQEEVPADDEDKVENDFDFPINNPKKRKRPIPKGSNLPALQNQKYGSNKIGWVSLVVFITVIICSFLIFEDTIKQSWPATTKLYRAIGLDGTGASGTSAPPRQVPIDELLKIGGLTPRLEQINNISHLIIVGHVENISNEPQTVPPLKVVLRDAAGADIRNWSFTPDGTSVKPGEKVDFETALPNPPAEARDISVILTAN